MDKLSDDYFLSLEKSGFVTKMKIFRCDKSKLTLGFVSDNYNGFILPNLTSLKIVDKSIEIQKTLKELFGLNNICSKIKEIDLSNTGLIDNGMFRFTKNISLFNNLESINLENTKITTYSQKYFKQIQKQKIKIIINEKKLQPRFRKKVYRISLGGSTIAGKTCYSIAYFCKKFSLDMLRTIGIDKSEIKYSKFENTKFIIWDTCGWNGRFDSIVQKNIFNSDGIILLFDLSQKKDFDDLPYCIRMISDYFEFEEFPVLLVGNKADLEKQVKQEEIDELLAKEKFIKYFEVSCKNLTNVDESFNYIFDYICEREKAFPIFENKTEKKKKKK